MSKMFYIGIVALLLSFFVASTLVQAQTTSPTPTSGYGTPTPTMLPGAAPKTGFAPAQ